MASPPNTFRTGKETKSESGEAIKGYSNFFSTEIPTEVGKIGGQRVKPLPLSKSFFKILTERMKL
jgi:hypothetical protein